MQTFGGLVNFNPHLHVLAADGAFLPDGRFVALPPVPGTLLAEDFRRAVLDFLVKNEALSDELRSRIAAVCSLGAMRKRDAYSEIQALRNP